MARYRGPRLKIVRRFQEPLPGLTQKNGERRPYPPGQHGPGRRSKLSDYRIRLDEKQKLRCNYGLNERQLRRYYKRAIKTKGDTGALLLQLLESRLDNVVFRAGFAPTIPAARQLINHGHVLVNGKRVDVASYSVRNEQKIVLKAESLKIPMVQSTLQARPLEIPSYLSVDAEKGEAIFTGAPTREDVPVDVQEQLIVEFYSRVA
jgi:small subunit ribosomal protein S4